MTTLADVATELAAVWVAKGQPSVPSNRMEFMQFTLGPCPAPLFDALMGTDGHMDWVLAQASLKVERSRNIEWSLDVVEEDGA